MGKVKIKRLIFQFWDGEIHPWVKISTDRFKKYADAHSSEYLFQTKSIYSKESSYYEKLRIVYDKEFEIFDQILYVDCDVIVEDFKKSVFDMVETDIGLIQEKVYPNMTSTPYHQTTSIQNEYKKIASNYKLELSKREDGGFIIYNTGVVLWNRDGLNKARKHFKDWRGYFNDKGYLKGMNLDQPFINLNLKNASLNITELPIQYNCFPRQSWQKGHFPVDPVFVHYTGGKKKFIMEVYNGIHT